MPRYPELKVILLAPMGKNGEKVDVDTLTKEEQDYVRDKIHESAERRNNELWADKALKYS